MTGRLRARTVTANGLQFGVLEVGSGPLALCLHGFPDSAHTWRYLLPALADAGFHAVAPFMRGYAPTGIPADRTRSMSESSRSIVGAPDEAADPTSKTARRTEVIPIVRALEVEAGLDPAAVPDPAAGLSAADPVLVGAR